MIVNLNGDPISSKVTEIVVQDGISITEGESENTVFVDYNDSDLDIHEVNRLIKGLELAKKLILGEGNE